MSNWCDDCAWPEACAARRECQRREAGEVRAAAPGPLQPFIDSVNAGGAAAASALAAIKRKIPETPA